MQTKKPKIAKMPALPKRIAEIIATHVYPYEGLHYEKVRQIANELAEMFYLDNPKFDKIKFLDMCGVPA